MYNIGGNKLGDKGVYQIVQHLKFIPHLKNLYLCTINYLRDLLHISSILLLLLSLFYFNTEEICTKYLEFQGTSMNQREFNLGV